MATVGKGTKIKFTLGITGLNEYATNFNFKLDFYAKENKTSVPTKFYTVTKDETDKVFPVEGEDYSFFVICDTTGLDTGTLGATVTIRYTDGDGDTTGTGAELTEIFTVASDVRLMDAPVAPDEEDDEDAEDGE